MILDGKRPSMPLRSREIASVTWMYSRQPVEVARAFKLPRYGLRVLEGDFGLVSPDSHLRVGRFAAT